jgi:hypothetical protein
MSRSNSILGRLHDAACRLLALSRQTSPLSLHQLALPTSSAATTASSLGSSLPLASSLAPSLNFRYDPDLVRASQFLRLLYGLTRDTSGIVGTAKKTHYCGAGRAQRISGRVGGDIDDVCAFAARSRHSRRVARMPQFSPRLCAVPTRSPSCRRPVSLCDADGVALPTAAVLNRSTSVS